MPHVGNGEHDFVGLEHYGPEAAEIIRQARIEARDAINMLEPFHIDSWPDLLAKLEDCLKTAKLNASIADPDFRKKQEQEQGVKK